MAARHVCRHSGHLLRGQELAATFLAPVTHFPRKPGRTCACMHQPSDQDTRYSIAFGSTRFRKLITQPPVRCALPAKNMYAFARITSTAVR